jgi:RND superfamily putative drug exporter
MFAALAKIAYHRKWLVLIAFAILLPLAGVFGGSVFSALKSGGFTDPGSESARATLALQQQLHAGEADIVALYTAPAGSTVDAPAFSTAVTAAVARASGDAAVIGASSYYSTGATFFLSNDRTQTFVVASLRNGQDTAKPVLDRVEQELRVPGVTVQFGGNAPANYAVGNTVQKDLERSELIALPITAVLLLAIFGSGVAAAVPLLLGAVAILLAFTILRVLALFTSVSVFAINVVTFLGLGLAIDYSLFILNRYREELPRRGPEGALAAAIGTTGRAVAFSGVTVAASMTGLFVFPQMFLRSMALGGIAVTLTAVVISLTVLPALIAAFGTKIEALRLPWARTEDRAAATESGFWHRVAVAVMRRPVIVAVALVAFLLLLATPFLRLHAAGTDARVLGAHAEVRQVNDAIAANFTPHETEPLQIVLQGNGVALTPTSIGALYDYVQQIAALPGVSAVNSVFSLLPGQSAAQLDALLSAPAALQPPALAAALPQYLRNGVARIDVISADEIDSAAGQAQVQALRTLTPPAGTNAVVGGAAAQLTDLKHSLATGLPKMIAIIAAVMLIVLFLAFGSLTLPLKAMAMNLLSLTASYGAMVWIFQDGRFENILRYRSLGTIDPTMPVLLFAIVFGLSMDYEVLLLSRIREEWDRTGDNSAAVAFGLEKTGRLITSAAGVLVVVAGAFTSASVVFMKEFFLGLALAVVLDATLVRALLVPATMRLMGHWNWWAPAPLSRLWQRIGLGDLEGGLREPGISPSAGD